MTESQLPDRILDQLRYNLQAAAIPFTEADIQGIIAKGFLTRLHDFEELVARTSSDLTPDYLAAWGSTLGDERPLPAATKPVPTPAPTPDSQPFATLTAVAAAIRTRQISPLELCEHTLERIAQRDSLLNAFQLVLADQARAAARHAEEEIATGRYHGPLHGVPVAIKDLIALKGTPTTAGSKILAHWTPAFNAAVVERLEAAGAVIIGKTRMSEFAYSPGSNNGHYGPTRNPWHPDHDAGGSSSGSAAAVADGLVYAALGSDTGGSIRIPAAFCGIVGLKPSFGRISLHGVVPLAWSLDHLGPLTRSVADAALLLELLAGSDSRDPRTREAVPPPLPRDLDAGVAGLRIGVLRDDGSGSVRATAAALEAWRSALTVLETQGAQLVEIDLPELESLQLLNGAILAMEAATYHQPMLRARLDDFGEFMRQRVLAAFAYNSRSFISAQQTRHALRQRCAAIFTHVDLLSTPTQPDVAPALGVPGWTNFTGPFNLLGWPAISVPAGLSVAGLPLGIQLIGQPWSEATILRAARVIEATLGVPIRPA